MADLGHHLKAALRVAVIGAGYAGLAAAVSLASRRVPVTLFEAVPQAGGRARSICLRNTVLDNGQHILLGAYHETLKLLKTVGVDEAQVFARLPLTLVVPDRLYLRAAPLPAPWHLLFGLLLAKGLSLSERLRAIAWIQHLRKINFRLPRDLSVRDMLKQARQGETISRLIWEPLCTAALNTPPVLASAQVFINVLRDSLCAGRQDSDLLLAKTDLSRVFPEPAARYLENHGAQLRFGCRVKRLDPDAGGFSLQTAKETLRATHVICAVAPQHVQALIGHIPILREKLAQIATLTWEPIYTLYSQYASHIRLPQPMLGLTHGIAQWVFDRGALGQAKGLLSSVVSASGAHEKLGRDELAHNIHRQLQNTFGLPQPLWHKVVVERQASFTCGVGLVRPGQQTALKNFYLAGDYTAGDYSATLEGAIRSGMVCSNNII
jgi:squalene-associated FAD-dependent desaturase